MRIVDVVRGGTGDAEGVLEFRASFRDASGAVGRLHERSRFARVDGPWAYVDGDIRDGDLRG